MRLVLVQRIVADSKDVEVIPRSSKQGRLIGKVGSPAVPGPAEVKNRAEYPGFSSPVSAVPV